MLVYIKHIGYIYTVCSRLSRWALLRGSRAGGVNQTCVCVCVYRARARRQPNHPRALAALGLSPRAATADSSRGARGGGAEGYCVEGAGPPACGGYYCVAGQRSQSLRATSSLQPPGLRCM